MRILAIDTSCDDSSAAVLDTQSWQLLSDVVISHAAKMQAYGGVVPEVASREHLKGLPFAVNSALEGAKLRVEEIDWFVATNRPGLIGALLVGVAYMKALAFACGKPFTALNHMEGHIYSPLLAELEGKKLPPFPWISLVVSGGHSELYRVESTSSYRHLGGTLDDAAGEAFDKVGKLLLLPYPAGPVLDKWVREKAVDADRKKIRFPRAMTAGVSLSFSGLKTAVALAVKAHDISVEQIRLQIAASAQEAIVDALVERCLRAQAQESISALVVSGGVACNSRLREKLPNAHFPSPKHCSDNAAMMALVAALKLRDGVLAASPSNVSASATESWPRVL